MPVCFFSALAKQLISFGDLSLELSHVTGCKIEMKNSNHICDQKENFEAPFGLHELGFGCSLSVNHYSVFKKHDVSGEGRISVP